MPYFVTDESPDCPAWATVKEDGEVVACHETEQEAIDQMVAISIAEGIEPGGSLRELPDNYRPALSEDVPEGRACGNCLFFDETNISEDGEKAFCQRWQDYVRGGDYCNAWEERESDDDLDELEDELEDILENEMRAVDLTPPAYMRAAARRGLAYYEDGKGGDGLTDGTIREARAMAEGNVTADKWSRISAWIARHLVDLDAPDANPNSDNYPSPGVVAHLLWGSGPSKTQARRALAYAQDIVARIEEEAEGRGVIGGAMSKLETRVNLAQFEVREEGEEMTFEGYASVFNSPSEPLPFREYVAPGAFTRSLKSRNDIKLLWNHDTGAVLGSTRAGTLRLSEDDRGLKVVASLAPTSLGRDVAALIKRGDVDSMSFGFSVIKDSWNAEGTERTLNSVRLHEVSIVSFPAYKGTAGSTSVRGLELAAQRADVDPDALADALLKVEAGEEITSDDRDLLSRVIDKLAPTPEPPSDDLGMLALKKKKLKLLEM